MMRPWLLLHGSRVESLTYSARFGFMPVCNMH